MGCGVAAAFLSDGEVGEGAMGGTVVCVGVAVGAIVGLVFCVDVVVVRPRARIGRRKVGGSRVMGVRSSRTERSSERLIVLSLLVSPCFPL